MEIDTFVTGCRSKLKVIQANAPERKHFNRLQNCPDAISLDESGWMLPVQRYEAARQAGLLSGEQTLMR
ncbi:MAG: hypothetical protein ACUVSY_13685 [Roseiflexus sp.]